MPEIVRSPAATRETPRPEQKVPPLVPTSPGLRSEDHAREPWASSCPFSSYTRATSRWSNRSERPIYLLAEGSLKRRSLPSDDDAPGNASSPPRSPASEPKKISRLFRDPHVFCGEKDSTNTTSKSLTREQHKRRFVCIIQWMGLNLSKSRQQGLSVAYSTPPQIQLVWKGSESIHIRIIIEYALSRSYRLTRNAYQPRSLPLAMDSNLEAFSYYPTDGSFAPSAFQPSALPII